MRTPEVEAEHIEAMAAITAASRAAGQERTRAEAAEARVKELERAHNDPDSNHAWLDADLVGKGGFTLAELADRLKGRG